MKSLIRNYVEDMRVLIYMNDDTSDTSVHEGSTTLVRGWLKWLVMRLFDIASQQDRHV